MHWRKCHMGEPLLQKIWLFLPYLFVCCVCVNEQKQCKGTRKPHGVHWEVRGQVAGVSFFLSRKSQGPSSGSQVWQQVPLPAEPSGQFLSVSFQVKHTHTVWRSDSTSGYLPRRKESMPTKTNVHRSLIHSSHAWKQPKCLPAAELWDEFQCPHLEE